MTTKTKLDYALRLAELGFYVFPLEPNSKLPHIDEWQKKASRDPQRIKKWWTDPVMDIIQDFNIGISTSRYEKDKALLVVDVDNKGDKRGDNELVNLEAKGLAFPQTLEVSTPTGGKHLLYFVDKAVRQGTNVLAPGLDIRSSGGYVVGVGSSVASGIYILSSHRRSVVRAPAWCVERCGAARPRRSKSSVVQVGVDKDRARTRANDYLQRSAPLARQGSGGDATTFAVAAKLKDLGVDEVIAWDLMLDNWNQRCEPPWGPMELKEKVANAYRYGDKPQGADAPEVQFSRVFTKNEHAEKVNISNLGTNVSKVDKVDGKVDKAHPFDKLNEDFAFVVAGGGHHILWETVDTKGCFKLEHLSIAAFHAMHAAWQMQIGNRSKPVTELWMSNKRRRSYDGICFNPGGPKEVLVDEKIL